MAVVVSGSGESGKVVIVFEQRTFVAFLISGSIYGDCASRALVCIYLQSCVCFGGISSSA